MQHNLQNGRKGNREDNAEQAKERPTNQHRDQHYDGMQSRFSSHDAWTQIHPFKQLPTNKQQDNTQDAAHTWSLTQ